MPLKSQAPGFLNIRLETLRQAGSDPRSAGPGRQFGQQPQRGEKKFWWNLSRPTPPARCTWAGRQAALGDAICNLYASQGWKRPPRVLLQRRGRADRHADQIHPKLRAKGFKPGDDCWPTDADNPLAKNFYNGDYIADIAQAFLNKETVQADDRAFTANGDVEDYDNIRQFAVAYLRNEQDKDLQAFNLKFDEYYLESSLY